MITQGKCPRCRVRWLWRGRPRLRDARCPTCGTALARTSEALRWPVRWAETGGRPAELRTPSWYRLLAADPPAAAADLAYRQQRHMAQAHAGLADPRCATCGVLASQAARVSRALVAPQL